MAALTATQLGSDLSSSRPRVAVLAHEGREIDLRRLSLLHRRSLAQLEIVTTCRLNEMLRLAGLAAAWSCPDNGGAIVLRDIVERRLDALIFLSEAGPSQKKVNPRGLLMVCELNGIPVATDVATAGILLTHLAGTSPPLRLASKHS